MPIVFALAFPFAEVRCCLVPGRNICFASPIYPLENISDVPARVVASEITREKLRICHVIPVQMLHTAGGCIDSQNWQGLEY